MSKALGGLATPTSVKALALRSNLLLLVGPGQGLKKLAAEGLVASRRRGWIVREHTSDEIREIYETRSALESYCARLAAQRGTEAEIQAIASLHRGEDMGILKSSREHLVEVNDLFHDAINFRGPQ